MSKMDETTEVAARVDAPIVLIIALGDAQQYLDGNHVLSAIYGAQAPVRKVLRQADDFTWVLLFPWREDRKQKFLLLEHFSDVTVDQMPDFIQTGAFYRAVFDHISDIVMLSAEDADNVRVVIGPPSLFEEDRPMCEVVKRYFPKATILVAESQHEKPAPLEQRSEPTPGD